MPSWQIVVLIAIGGLMVVLGNIFYPVVKDHEKKVKLRREAEVLIKNELAFNVGVIQSTLRGLPLGNGNLEMMRSSTWTTISNAGLISNFDADQTVKLINVYALIEYSNAVNAKFIDTLIGISSALGTADRTKQFYNVSVERTYRRTADAIKETGLVVVPDQLLWAHMSAGAANSPFTNPQVSQPQTEAVQPSAKP